MRAHAGRGASLPTPPALALEPWPEDVGVHAHFSGSSQVRGGGGCEGVAEQLCRGRWALEIGLGPGLYCARGGDEATKSSCTYNRPLISRPLDNLISEETFLM